MTWQLQDAKQRFSEVIRKAESEGPQFVTRHGEQVAVLMSLADYRALISDKPSLLDFLRTGPDISQLDLTRSQEHPRDIEL